MKTIEQIARDLMGDLYCARNDFDNVTSYRIDLIYDKAKRLVEALQAHPTRKAAFIKESTGALVASIQEDGDGAVEVQALDDGKFVLTIHSRVGETTRFEDLSATLEQKHFELLGSIASQVRRAA